MKITPFFRGMPFAAAGCALAAIFIWQASAFAQLTDWEPNPDRNWVFTSEYGVESVTFRAAGYDKVEKSPFDVRFYVKGLKTSGPEVSQLKGIVLSEITIKPDGDGAYVTLTLSGLADGFSINAAPYSSAFPNSPSVVAGFTGLKPRKSGGSAAASGDEYPAMGGGAKSEGDYELPPFEHKYKYSDVLVTLHVSGVSVVGILQYMSLVGNISIVLDPYWNRAPTGGGRPPVESGGGAGGGAGGIGTGGIGTGGAGFSGFGQGLISVDLEKVPFDLALDLIITSAGLRYFEIS